MSVYVIASLTSPLTVQRLSQIQAPALILVGDPDIADVIAYAGAIEAALPIAFFEVWKDTGHLIQFEHPAELVERLHRFARLADRKEVAVKPAVLNSYLGKYKFFNRSISDAEIQQFPKTMAVTCVANRGDAIVMRPLLLHSSSPAKVPSSRRVLHLEFSSDELPSGVEWQHRV